MPQLEFLAVLLGDEPALDLKDSFYRRLLARDQDEAEDLILERLKSTPAEEIFDAMLLLRPSRRTPERSRGEITEAMDEVRSSMLSVKFVDDVGDSLGHPARGSPRKDPAA